MFPKIHVTIDFECLVPDIWQSMAMLVCIYPSGKIVDRFEIACDRGTQPAESTRSFWEMHPAAFRYNVDKGAGVSVSDAEARVCAYVTYVKRTYPSFYMISDVPENDIGLINDILRRGGLDMISKRPRIHVHDRGYFQSICTWSTKRVINILFGQEQTPSSSYHDLVQLRQGGHKHTPLVDSAAIMDDHFRILDRIEKLRIGNNHRMTYRGNKRHGDRKQQGQPIVL